MRAGPVSSPVHPLRRPAIASSLGLAALLFTIRAEAIDEASGARLSWVRADGADSCPSIEQLTSQVVQLLGRDPFQANPAQHIEAVAERHHGQWRARLYVRTGDHPIAAPREILDDAPDCSALATAVSLAIALSIDPTVRPAPPPPPSPTPPRPAPVPSFAPSEPRPAVNSTVALGAFGQLGLLPGSSFGAELSAEPWSQDRLHLRVGAIFLPEVRADRPGGAFLFGATAISLSPCVHLFRGQVASVAACGTFVVGAAHALALDLTPVAPAQRGWFALGASARASLRVVGPLSVEARLDVSALPLRVQFNLQGAADSVFEQSPVALSGFLGLGLSFR